MPDGSDDDKFPIVTFDQTVVPFLPGTVGVGAIDLSDLGQELSPHVTDPFVDTVDGTVKRPATAMATSGPHRYTILVPNQGENSILSLGQADGAGTPRINDTGLTAQSKTRLHLKTTEAANRTMVALGAGTNHGFDGHKGNKLAGNTGFMMVTDHASWIDAKEQLYAVSQTKDVVVRAAQKKILLKADVEDVIAEARRNVTLGAVSSVKIIGDSGLLLDDPDYKTEAAANLTQSFDLKAQKKAANIADMVQSVYGIIGAAIKLNGKEPVWKKLEWKELGWLDYAKTMVDMGKLASSIYRYVDSKDAPGKVDVQAETYASISGGMAASIYGALSASVTSAVSASMIGGTAGIKAAAWASVWAGIATSVKAGKDVSLEGEYGKAKVSGRKDVSVASTTAGVIVQGETNAQLSAKSGEAYVFGKSGVYCGAGSDEGMGFHAKKGDAWIGKITGNANKLDNPVRNTNYIEWKGDDVAVVSKKETHNIQDAVEFKSSGFKVDAKSSNVEMKGSKILLG